LDFFDIIGITQLIEYGKEKLGICPEKVEEKKIYHSEQITPKKYSFRPRTLEEYIGQENAKELIKINLKKIETMKPVHLIISGAKGTGKSTLAYIVANYLKMNIMTYVAGSFTIINLMQFVEKNNKSEQPMILFVDEIHSLDKSVGEFMYILLEQFILPIGNVDVRPFIFIGCTTDLNILQKKLAPMIDRCQSINLEHYSSNDIKQILHQYNIQTHQIPITDEEYNTLSSSCRYTPRIALSLFDDFVIVRNIEKVLKAHQIIKNSLTTNDIIILKHLAEIKKPTGVEVLSIITQQTKQDYMTLQEPFLIMEKYISRTSRGRIITNSGIELLQGLDNV